jgi:hypothetical protein
MATIFMSFIHEEKFSASCVSFFIKNVLGHSIDTFMSSDETAIYAGEDWMTRILKELETAKVLISMLSPDSVKRPWINFEAGAAWMGKTIVIPVCFGGLTIAQLPKPYSSLQALEIETHEGAYYLASSIAHHLNVATPKKPIFRDVLPVGFGSRDPEENRSLFNHYKNLRTLLKLDRSNRAAD